MSLIEKDIVGALLLNPKKIGVISTFLKPEHFDDSSARYIYEIQVNLYNNKDTITLSLIYDELKKKTSNEDKIDKAIRYVIDAANDLSTTIPLDTWATTLYRIKEEDKIKGDFKNIIATSKDLVRDLSDNAVQLMANNNLTERSTKNSTQILSIFHNYIKFNQEHSNRSYIGLNTGFRKLSRMLDGLQPNTYTVIGAGTGVGKTNFLMNLLDNLTSIIDPDYEVAVLLFSMEMTIAQVMCRYFAMKLEMPIADVKRGNFNEEQLTNLGRVDAFFSNCIFEIADEQRCTNNSITDIYNQFNHKCNNEYTGDKKLIKVIALDYVQLVKGDDNKQYKSKVQQVESVTERLRMLRDEPDTLIIALSQFSRKTNDKSRAKDFYRPDLSDLKDSSQIEQDANQVVLLWRPDYYGMPQLQDGRDAKDVMVGIVAKNREGMTGDFHMLLKPECAKLLDYDSIEHNF